MAMAPSTIARRLLQLHMAVLFFLLGNGSNNGVALAAASRTLSFSNGCSHPVWVGALNGATSAPLSLSGFFLASGAASSLAAPEDDDSSSSWSGTFWARTGCATDAATGRFSCATADCGSGDVACHGRGPHPPVTLAELTLSGAGGQDFYDVSLVDGFNVPVRITPNATNNGGSGCRAAACAGDVNAACPADLRVVVVFSGSGEVAAACRSACGAYGSARYCCSGEYGTPAACGPTGYSEAFKSVCPDAYSYAYDDATSTFTCAGASGYHIDFCPSTGN